VKAIRTFGLAALAALLAMAFVGASSAMAESTALCSADDAGCGVTHVHETTLSGVKAKLLTALGNVECDVLFLGDTVKGTSAPLVVEGNFAYSNCGDCTVEEVGGGVEIEVLKSGHETAAVTGEGEVRVICGASLDCTYNGEEFLGTGKGPLLSSETNGSVVITEQTAKKIKGSHCPSTSILDITTTPLSARYIAQVKIGLSTALCNQDPAANKEEACPEGHLVTHVHETTLSGAKGKLLTSIVNVECDVLFLGDTVTSLGKPLVIEGNFIYSNCGSCTVEEVGGGVEIEVLRLGHETTEVTGEGEVHVNCSGLNCTYNGEELLGAGKGPLLSSETNGSVSISGQAAKKVSGLFCPSTAKLDITVTPLSATYIGS